MTGAAWQTGMCLQRRSNPAVQTATTSPAHAVHTARCPLRLPTFTLLLARASTPPPSLSHLHPCSLRLYPHSLTVADARRIHGDNQQLSSSAWRAGICLTHNLLQAFGDMTRVATR